MKRTLSIICIVLLVVISILGYGIYWVFYDIQRLEGQEVIQEVSSPNDTYTITAYLNNGGATTGYAVLCSEKNNSTGKEKTYTGSTVAPKQTLYGLMKKQYKSTVLN